MEINRIVAAEYILGQIVHEAFDTVEDSALFSFQNENEGRSQERDGEDEILEENGKEEEEKREEKAGFLASNSEYIRKPKTRKMIERFRESNMYTATDSESVKEKKGEKNDRKGEGEEEGDKEEEEEGYDCLSFPSKVLLLRSRAWLIFKRSGKQQMI